eukprot:3783067-Rhodomonas_salina.1
MEAWLALTAAMLLFKATVLPFLEAVLLFMVASLPLMAVSLPFMAVMLPFLAAMLKFLAAMLKPVEAGAGRVCRVWVAGPRSADSGKKKRRLGQRARSGGSRPALERGEDAESARVLLVFVCSPFTFKADIFLRSYCKASHNLFGPRHVRSNPGALCFLGSIPMLKRGLGTWCCYQGVERGMGVQGQGGRARMDRRLSRPPASNPGRPGYLARSER